MSPLRRQNPSEEPGALAAHAGIFIPTATIFGDTYGLSAEQPNSHSTVSPKMPAPPILQQIYRTYIYYLGEPDHSRVFDDPKKIIDGFPSRVDVLVWNPDDKCDMTTFATIGMASVPMPKASHRAELHFRVRKSLRESHRIDVSVFLANLAMYPFHTGEPLDWWHTLSHPGEIPLFLTAKCVLLHPRFSNQGWDSIATDEGDVRILNVVPITVEEKNLRQIRAILNRLKGLDIFEPR